MNRDKMAEKQKPMQKQEDKAQMYMEYQMLNQQLKEMQGKMEQISLQMNEIAVTKQAVEELPFVEKNAEILAPLAPGIFIKAQLKGNNEFHINVGGKVVVSKKAEEVIDLLSKQEEEIKKVEEMLAAEWQEMVLRLQELHVQLQ
jgi:prefoldin alpha subunit